MLFFLMHLFVINMGPCHRYSLCYEMLESYFYDILPCRSTLQIQNAFSETKLIKHLSVLLSKECKGQEICLLAPGWIFSFDIFSISTHC